MYGFNLKKHNLFSHLYVIILVLSSSFSQAANIVKWVDENGKTHYGDRMPEQYVNRKNTVMNTQGVTLKQNQAVDYQNLQRQQAQAILDEEKINKDSALLNSYTSDTEIDLAYLRTLDIDNAALEGLKLNMRLAANRLLESQKKVAFIQTGRKTVPPLIYKEMLNNQVTYNRSQKNIELKKQEMAVTKLKFEADAKRYRELKSAGASRN